MTAAFAHLHLHTEFSLLDGLGRIEEYMTRAKEYGMQHLAITDHGVMYGVLDWYRAARSHDLHPLIGVEAYLAPNGIAERKRENFHLLLLAENEVGYRNLLKLSSRASIEGFYYRPRIDFEMLNEYREGIICTSACLGGPVANPFLRGNDDEAIAMAKRLRDIFGPQHFYLEIQDHGMKEQQLVNRRLLEVSKQHDLPLLATNDVHYVSREDAAIQDLLVCIQTNVTIDDPKRMKMPTDELYFKSPEEMARLFGELPESLANTIRIAERCNVDLDFSRLLMPDPGIPADRTAQQYLEELCWAGLNMRYPEITEEVRKRLEYELFVIEQTGFASYMLIVSDIARFAREQDIPFGVRGSAAASIVLYTLNITDIDPVVNRLVFERFLNLERREMPDIDMDFADNRRAQVIEYVAQKYGHDRVAQIITFGTMGAKASLRDVGRAQGWAHGDVDRVARLIPTTVNMTLDRALAESSELRGIYESDTKVRELIDTAQRLEGISRHAGTHAAGVVISAEPLDLHVALQRSARGEEGALPTTQFSMENVAAIGLLKMDFLGLANLTILGEAVSIIEQQRGERIIPRDIPDGDEPTYTMLGNGETFGVFQLESGGMRRAVTDLRPQSVSELAALVALYRPGPMQHIPTFCKAKRGEEEIRYPHADLADVLDETYGVIVYQDQVLLIAQRFAGYTLGAADIMRKAMGKKIAEKMRAERENFIKGAGERGYKAKDAETVFDLIEPFAGYAFNKAHAVCYGTISYQTAYLKANYPAEYMTAVLRLAPSHPSGTHERVAAAVSECVKLGIPVLGPDINLSAAAFEVQVNDAGKPAIRFGLSVIKNVGEGVVQAICAVRDTRPGQRFTSLEDLCESVEHAQFNKRLLESLIRSGALDSLGDRSQLLGRMDSALAAAATRQRARARGQMGLFGELLLDETVVETHSAAIAVATIPNRTLLAWEKEYLGVYLSDHPLTEVTRMLAARGEHWPLIANQDAGSAGEQVRIFGMVVSVRKMTTRGNRTMAVARVEDLSGSLEVVLFPNVFDTHGAALDEGAIVMIKGKTDQRNEGIQILVEEVKAWVAPEEPTTMEQTVVLVRVPLETLQPEASSGVVSIGGDGGVMERLTQLMRAFIGEDLLVLEVATPYGPQYLRCSQRIDWSREFARAIDDIVGPGAYDARTRMTVVTGSARAA